LTPFALFEKTRNGWLIMYTRGETFLAPTQRVRCFITSL
jgi:hypothetical protein